MIIDGCGLLFRAYYAVPQMLSHDNQPVSALYGFIKSLKFLLRRLLSKKSNNLLAIALDVGGGKNFRYQIYSAYKNNRSVLPEDLISQLQLLQPMLNAFGIPCLYHPIYEADDIIATCVKLAKRNDYESVIVSGDKDLMQLISNDVLFFDVCKKKFCFEKDVREKFNVAPNQICDYLSIVGDRSDNIPGIRGIGKKIASELLMTFNTLENIYANLNKIEDAKTVLLLENGYNAAMMSKRLVSLQSDVELQYVLNDMKWNGFKENFESISAFLYKYSLEALMNIF